MKEKTKIILIIILIAVALFTKIFSEETIFGIDVSDYQDGDINWKKVKNSRHNVKFVILRATMGENRKDDEFAHRAKELRETGFIIGAYHYYDPNETSVKQANNYLLNVKLQKGDFIPIVDIEELSRIQSTKRLLIGLKNWLNIVEKQYGTKPMIYSSYSFYLDYLKNNFSEYPLWIAAYSCIRRVEVVNNCKIHQFTDNVSIMGINGKVDGNIIKEKKLITMILK